MSKSDMPEYTNTKILEIDKNKLVKTLEDIGAIKTLDTTAIIENYEAHDSEALGIEYTENDLETKLAPIVDGMYSMKEFTLALQHDLNTLEFVLIPADSVGENHKAALFALSEKETLTAWLTKNGFKRTAHQEVKRIHFTCERPDVDFLIEQWPSIPPYVEITGEDAESIHQAAKLIGYTKSDLTVLSKKELFRRYSASPTYMSFADKETEIAHEDLERLVHLTIKNHAPHLAHPEVKLIADHYIFAEYSGKKTHGLRKLCWDVQFYGDRLGTPQLSKDSPAISLIDGRREIGPLAANLGVETVIAKAKQGGVGIVGITGAQRFGILATWTSKIAEAGLIGVLTTSTEPFTALSETATGVVGTNPLSISIPYKDKPLVYDAALSKAPVNMMWLYRLLGMELPDETFLGEKGRYTNDPFRSKYVDVFGGSKGSGFAIMLQILSGPLMGVKSHDSFKDPYENAFYFQAIDPSFFQPMENFEVLVEDFIRFAKQAPLREGYDGLHLPGEKSRYNLDKAIKAGKIRVHTGVVGWLEFLGSN